MHSRLFFVPVAAALAIAALGFGCGGSPTAPQNPPPACTFAVTPQSATFPAAGATVSFHVDTAAACKWTASSSAGWVTWSATDVTGPGNTVATALENTSSDVRTVVLTVAGTAITGTQEGRGQVPCEFVVSPDSQTWGPEGGNGRLTVQTGAACIWTARSVDGWLTLKTTTGIGPGSIEYSVPAYDGFDQRQTRVLVNDRPAIVRQDGRSTATCTYAVDPTSTRLHWHGTSGDGMDVRITTAAGCPWTAASGGAWLTLTGAASGAGSGVTRISVASYTGLDPRTAPLQIRWPTPTQGQNVVVKQEGCAYALGLPTSPVPASAARYSATLLAGPMSVDCNVGCPWDVRSEAVWLRVTNATSGSGDSLLSFSVDANTTGAQRTGAIVLAGVRFSLVQDR